MMVNFQGYAWTLTKAKKVTKPLWGDLLPRCLSLIVEGMDEQKTIRPLLLRARWAKEVSDQALDRILDCATVRAVSCDDFILRYRDFNHGFFGVLSGRVRLSIPAVTGDEFILWDLTEGLWFGSTTLIDKAPVSYDARALVDSKIVEVPRSAVVAVAQEFPEIYEFLFADQALYSRMMYKLMIRMLFYPLRPRLAFRLLVLIDIYGRKNGPSAILEEGLSQGDFAKLVNGSRQQVNRIFRQWDEEGIVKLVDGQYRIPSVKRLAIEAKSTDP